MPLFRLCLGLLAAMVTLPGAALALCDGADALPDRVIALIDRRAEPDLELEGLLKRQHTRIKYFQGSLMNPGDLERAKVRGRAGLVRD